MFVFLISQSANDNYDTYDSAVVVAPDEDAARQIDPSNGRTIDWGNSPSTWCYSASDVKVKKIGVAIASVDVGVICSSFNAWIA